MTEPRFPLPLAFVSAHAHDLGSLRDRDNPPQVRWLVAFPALANGEPAEVVYDRRELRVLHRWLRAHQISPAQIGLEVRRAERDLREGTKR